MTVHDLHPLLSDSNDDDGAPLEGFPLKMISEVHELTDELRQSEGRLRSILETASDAIITISERGIVESYNNAAEKLFGYTEEEVVSQNVSMLMPSPDREQHDGYLVKYLKTGVAHILGSGREVVGKRKDGTTVPIRLAVSEVAPDPICLKDGDVSSPRFFTGILHDLSEMKDKEDELRKSKEAAEAASKAKSQFVANMSHEIRTPMTAILGFADVLLDNVEKKVNIEAVTTIKRNGALLLDIINNILDMSKIEAGKVEIENISCYPQQIVSDVVSMMNGRATTKGLSLRAKSHGKIPHTILSDPTRLRQILINIVGNAVKFTQTGGVEIATRFLCDSCEGCVCDETLLQFQVTDTGIGMTESQIAELFEPFSQADSSTTRIFGGSGLGLAICKGLAELLKGEIDVRSEPGKGSEITVTIPVQVVHEDLALQSKIDRVNEAGLVKSAKAHEKLLERRRILLAEDGPDNQRLASLILRKAGAEVSLADNGQLAFNLAMMALAKNQPYDVILMDMQMPVMDGYVATRKLRERLYSRPIIAFTAHAATGDREKCLDAGCSGYVSKPIDRVRLVTEIAKACDDQVIEAGV